MLKGLKKLIGPKTDDELQIQKYKSILRERSEPSPELHLKIGRLYEKIGEKSNASLEYRQAARIYMEREEYVGALVANKSIVQIDRKDADALANVAFIEFQQGIKLSPLEFETFLQDIGQPLRASKHKHDSTTRHSTTKRPTSRLALSRDHRRQNTEKADPNFQANRQQLLDLIAGDTDATERFDASFDTERHALINTIKEESTVEDEGEAIGAEPAPQTTSKNGEKEDLPLIDLRQDKAPGEQILDSEFLNEEVPFMDLTQDDASGEQILNHEASEKDAVPNVRDALSQLDSCQLFSQLSEAEHQQLRQHAHVREIVEGNSITLAHDGRQSLFVSLEGLIELVIEGDEIVKEPEVFLLRAGDFWGEHEVLGQSDVKISAVAKTPSTIAEIPKMLLAPIVKKHPSLLEQLKKICKRRCFFPFLRHVAFFQGLTIEEIQNIAEHLFTKDMKKGDLLIHEGEYDESIFLIQSGKVEVYTNFVEREELQVVKMEQEFIHLAYLGAGDFFGEGAHFTKEPRSATIVALTDGRLLKLPTSHLKKLIHDYPRLESILQQYHQQRVKASAKIIQSTLGMP